MSQGNAIFDEHEQFQELCALYPTGALSEDDIVALREHVLGCLECRDRLADYQQLVRDGMSLLAEGRVECRGDLKSAFSPEEAKLALYAELDRQQRRITNCPVRLRHGAHSCNGLARQPNFWHLHRSRLIQLAGGIFVLLCAGVAAMSWRPLVDTLAPDGRFSRTEKAASHTTDGSGLTALVAERDSLNVQLKQRDAKVEVLTSRIDSQLKEISRLKETSDRYRSENERINSKLTLTQAEQNAVEEGRSSLEAQLNQAQDSLIRLRRELGDIESQRRNDLLHSVSVETKLAQVSTQLREQYSTINDQQALLASDRDIRELMGARDLYIADVFDVDPNSRTQKPFGRVFYTKNKSLIFYAFDLDQQRGIKNASAFQAWGLGDSDNKHPLNLGILYLDNQANRRWVLKFEDPVALARINSVFVTVEPSGGSARPSGKPLLYAYLSNQPNHP
jgi:anti-sigma-K factor RskA